MLTEYLITDTSPAAAGNATSATTIAGLERFDWFSVDATLVGATGGTLDVYLQRWSQWLQEWRDWAHFPQLTAGAATVRYVFDSNIAASTGISSIGQGASPVLAASTLACAHPGTKVRALYVAGASTSAGAIQKIALIGWRHR